MVKLLSGRLLAILDEGKDNIGRVAQHNYLGYRSMIIPKELVQATPDEETPPTPEDVYYDHIIFVKEMSDEVEIDGVTYTGMHRNAIIAVIPD